MSWCAFIAFSLALFVIFRKKLFISLHPGHVEFLLLESLVFFNTSVLQTDRLTDWHVLPICLTVGTICCPLKLPSLRLSSWHNLSSTQGHFVTLPWRISVGPFRAGNLVRQTRHCLVEATKQGKQQWLFDFTHWLKSYDWNQAITLVYPAQRPQH